MSMLNKNETDGPATIRRVAGNRMESGCVYVANITSKTRNIREDGMNGNAAVQGRLSLSAGLDGLFERFQAARLSAVCNTFKNRVNGSSRSKPWRTCRTINGPGDSSVQHNVERAKTVDKNVSVRWKHRRSTVTCGNELTTADRLEPTEWISYSLECQGHVFGKPIFIRARIRGTPNTIYNDDFMRNTLGVCEYSEHTAKNRPDEYDIVRTSETPAVVKSIDTVERRPKAIKSVNKLKQRFFFRHRTKRRARWDPHFYRPPSRLTLLLAHLFIIYTRRPRRDHVRKTCWRNEAR